MVRAILREFGWFRPIRGCICRFLAGTAPQAGLAAATGEAGLEAFVYVFGSRLK